METGEKPDKPIIFVHINSEYTPLNAFRLNDGEWEVEPDTEVYFDARFDVYLIEDEPSGYKWQSDDEVIEAPFNGTPGACPEVSDIVAIYDKFVATLNEYQPLVAFCFMIE